MRRFPPPWTVEQIPDSYKVKLNDGREAGMRKLLIGMTGASLLLGFLGGNAEATSLTGAITFQPRTNHSLVEKAACRPGYPPLPLPLLAEGLLPKAQSPILYFLHPKLAAVPHLLLNAAIPSTMDGRANSRRL
jgi:hypothetical protein